MLKAEEYRQAEFGYTLAESRRGFKIHAAVYAVVMTGLFILNSLLWVYSDGDFPWVVFPLVCWGIGLTFHYFDAFRRESRSIRAQQETIEDFAEAARRAA